MSIFATYNSKIMKYKRILLKLSGEALMGERQYGIDPARLAEYAEEIKKIHEQGVQIAIVIGGGNIFRGVAGASNGMDRVQGDYMGMLATGISGSGPTLFTITDDLAKAKTALSWLDQNYLTSARGFSHICRLDEQGSRNISQPNLL